MNEIYFFNITYNENININIKLHFNLNLTAIKKILHYSKMQLLINL